MKPKINCNECWYYVDQPWPTCEKSWCRMLEGKIPKDNVKTRCKHYEPRAEIEKKMAGNV